MPGPQITLIASLQDITGSADSNPNGNSRLRVTLCGFGGLLPRIVGTSMLAKVAYISIQTGAQVSIPIWGNDAITPAGTFYCIEIIDSKGVRVQANNYQLTGSGTQDLSNLSPYLPPPPVSAPLIPIYSNPIGGALQFINGSLQINGNLTVTGTINGNTGGGLIVVPDAANITFDGSQGSAFKTILNIGNTVLTVTNMANKAYVAIVFQQDATGGRTVTWPANVHNNGEVNPGPNIRSSQTFMADTDGSLIAVSTMQYS